MRILFADPAGVCRYSTILIAKELQPEIKVFEAETLHGSKLTMFSEAIDLMFISANIISSHDIEQIKKIRNIKIVLITDCEFTYASGGNLELIVDGVLDLQQSLDNTRKFLADIMYRFCDNNKPNAHVQPLGLSKFITDQVATRLN